MTPDTPEEPKPVGIWIRVSTDLQAETESPEHHEERARKYAEVKGWRVEEVYRLEAVSGKSVTDHPETERMLEDVAEGRISGLIFSKLARLARNTRELLDFADHFQDHNADLISLQEAIDTTTPAGRLFYTVIAAMAQWEREEIAERVRASVKTRAEMGKKLGGVAPFGYQWQDGEMVPHPDEAPIRKRMYHLFLEHRRIKTVARVLNEEGHRTRRGNEFSDTTVRRLLTDPTAKGWRRANYTRSTGGGSWEEKPEEEWEWHPVEPVVEEEVWDQVNQILEERRKKYVKRPGKKPSALFSGLAYCHCGEKMYPRSQSPKYVCRECRNKIPIEDLRALFREQLKAFALDPSELEEQLEKADEEIRERRQELEALQRERADVKDEMDRVYRLYIEEEIGTAGFGQRNRPLEARLEQLDQRIAELQGEIDFLKIQHLSRDEILSEAQDLHSRWPDLELEEKQQVVENVLERITIGEDEVTLRLRYLPLVSKAVPTRQRTLRGSWPPPAGSGRGRSPRPGPGPG